MLLLTRKYLASIAVTRWRTRYRDPTYVLSDKRTVQEILRSLEALGPNPTPEQINQVIGNDSWTLPPRCDECKSQGNPVVQLGKQPDYESRTAYICEECLRKAMSLFRG